MAPRGQLVFAVGIGALLFVPVFKSLTGLPPYLGMLLGLGTLWLLTDAIHYGETGRQKLKVPQALSRIDTQGVLFFLGILLSVGRWVLLELLATPICSSTFSSLSTHATKVDGPYLVAFFLFVTFYYSNRMKILRVCKRTWRSYDQSIPESFGANLDFLWIIEVHQRWAIRRPHRSSPKKIVLMTIEPTMHKVHSLLNTWCLFGVRS